MYKITQIYNWDNKIETIKYFNCYWMAYFYKLINYDFGADPAWKLSFSWTIKNVDEYE